MVGFKELMEQRRKDAEAKAAGTYVAPLPAPSPAPKPRSPSNKDWLAYLSDEYDITEWEITFCESVFKWVAQGKYPSAKQPSIIDRMVAQYTTAEDIPFALDYASDMLEWDDSSGKETRTTNAEPKTKDDPVFDNATKRPPPMDFDDMDDDIPF